jgi:chromate transporter
MQTMLRPPKTTRELFVGFTLLALQGFGGVLGVAQQVLCERRKWLTQEDFVEVLAMSQVLPGSSVCNIAMIVGERFMGWRGALAALAGITLLPLAIVLAMTAAYAKLAAVPAVAGALEGMAAVATGLIGGTALKLGHTLKGNVMRVPACILLGLATFVTVALLHWSLVWVFGGLGVIAWGYAWLRLRAVP